MNTPVASLFSDAKRIVIKVGSSLVTNDGKGLALDAINRWAKEIAHLASLHKEILLVSSGAIAEGVKRLGWAQRPTAMHELQAAAAVGQMGLIHAYETAFAQYGLRTAQILLTHEDLSNRRRYLNARSTLRTLSAMRVIPIINENDTITTDEIKVGDNDTLGALVVNLIEADLLVLLTDQQGLFTADPRRDPNATLMRTVRAGDPALEDIAGGAGTSVGKGGMLTKVWAAKRAARSGASTIIASGREPEVLSRLLKGESIGTTFIAATPPLLARKQWIADQLQLAGKLFLDEGAARALTQEGKSLLSIGVTHVEGTFDRGEVVGCYDASHRELARGLVNYNHRECLKIARHPSAKIAEILGHMEEPELIHRDNMVVTWFGKK